MNYVWALKRLEERGIGTIEELTLFMESACVKFKLGEPMLRGVGNHERKLQAKAFRDPPLSRGQEASLMNDFRELGPSRVENAPGIEEELRWLILAQHFGLRTRLLDWTWSGLVALFFAVEKPENDGIDGKIWASTPAGLTQWAGKVTHGNLVTAAFEYKCPAGGMTSLRGYQITPRIAAQQGLFTIHGDGTLFEEQEGIEEHLVGVNVRKDAKDGLRKQLEWLGVTRHCLFPDLGNLADYINAKEWLPSNAKG